MVASQLLREKLETLPDQPGVYLFKDGKGEIVYVGKAKSLRSRVRSYFTSRDDGRYQFPKLVASIRDLEIILTRDEVEALATEAALIKKHRPRYNVDLRDDKSFPYLKITREAFSRITLTRKPRTADADYFGPFTNVRETRSILRTLKGILQICNCSLPLIPKQIAAGKYRLCLDYHIGRCAGPCVGKISPEVYRRNIERFKKFLMGRHDEIISVLTMEMQKLAAELRFEEAAAVRDRLTAIQRFSERQRRVSSQPIDSDAVALVREDGYAAFSVIKVRSGRIVGQSPFHMERAAELDDASLMEAFMVRHYDLVDAFPDEIQLMISTPDPDSLSAYLTRLAGKRIRIQIPLRGEKREVVETARRNAEHLLLERRLMAEKRDFVPRAVKSLQENLHLPAPPLLIEAFDISNLHGSDSIASMVTFKDGKPFKSGYRLFKIKTVQGIDDCASMAEAVRRRYGRLKAEIDSQTASVNDGDVDSVSPTMQPDEIEVTYPDLILVDGGSGQLSSVRRVLEELNLSDLKIVGLAKRLEEIYIPGMPDPLTLPKSSSALRLLQQVRDEAHRFAVSRHRLIRGKRQVKSKMDDIPGVGPSRRLALLNKFGSVKRIAAAKVDEIAATPGISRTLAAKIKETLI